MTFARDTYRAVLVVAVVAVLRGDIEFPLRPVAATPPVETSQPRPWQPAPPVAPSPPPMPPWQGQALPATTPSVQWQPPQIVIREEQKRPLRRVAAAMTDLGDALIGVVR